MLLLFLIVFNGRFYDSYSHGKRKPKILLSIATGVPVTIGNDATEMRPPFLDKTIGISFGMCSTPNLSG